MKQVRPDGFTPRVSVLLHSDLEPIEVAEVETARDHPWVLFNVPGNTLASGSASSSDKRIFTPEGNIARVVIDYVEEGEPPKRDFGFGVREAEEDEPSDEG